MTPEEIAAIQNFVLSGDLDAIAKRIQDLTEAGSKARIALTLYREHMEEKTRTRYPFGIETENELRKILDEPAI